MTAQTDTHDPQNTPTPPPAGEASMSPLDQLKAERDQAVAARQRALADFANYQRRVSDNELRAGQQAAAGVIRTVLPVLDHFDLALNQDHRGATIEQFVGGVRMVREELVKALQSHGVKRLEPAVGDEFQPGRHEAVMQQKAEGVGPNRIAALLQSGYALGEMVLRPAKVAVTPGNE